MAGSKLQKNRNPNKMGIGIEPIPRFFAKNTIPIILSQYTRIAPRNWGILRIFDPGDAGIENRLSKKRQRDDDNSGIHIGYRGSVVEPERKVRSRPIKAIWRNRMAKRSWR
jgi:hypothetical protein